MKITSLTIKPNNSWTSVSEDNPLRAVVTLADEKSKVETVIPEHMVQPLLDLVAGIVADAALDNVKSFVASVSAVEARAEAKMIGGAP